MPGVLDARERDEAIRKLAAGPLDVLIIGGGITGAGAALDAASRGLRVGLVEARDLASGTSSRSSKLIHGGLRYLEQGDFKLVKEALRERDLLVSRLAPHLVRPVPFLYPLYRKVVERPYVGAGLVIYDAMEGIKRPVPHHRHLTVRGALRRAPALRPDRLAGAMLYYDAQVDDARYTVTVARTAVRHGATVLTRASAISLLRDGERVTGARVRDEESGRTFDVAATSTVVCAGVWSDPVFAASGVRAGYQVRMSKGVHLVMPRSAIDSETGMIIRTSKSVLFFIPTGDRWIVGTTDTEWTGDRAEPGATAEDVDYILGEANRVLARPLSRSDVLAVYAGLRPLVAEPAPVKDAGLGRQGRAGRRRVGEADHQALARARGRRAAARAGLDRRRQVHHLPADGEGRGGRRGRELPAPGSAVGHRRAAAARRRRAARGPRLGPAAGRRLRRARRVGRAPGRPVRVDRGRGPRADPGGQVARPAAGGRRSLPAGRGRLRRHPRGRAARDRCARPPGAAAHRVGRLRGVRRPRGRRDHGAAARLEPPPPGGRGPRVPGLRRHQRRRPARPGRGRGRVGQGARAWPRGTVGYATGP